MCGTVGVPQGESGIECSRSCLNHGVGGVAIQAVYVRNLIGLNQCMIETGVEVGFLVFCSGHVDAAQVAVPIVMCRFFHSFKVPCGHFGFHILPGAFYAGSGESDFHQQFFAGLHVKRGNDAFAFFGLTHRQVEGVGDGSVELHHEEIILIDPNTVAHMPGQGLSVFPVHLAFLHLRVILVFVPCRSVLQVDEDGSRVGIVIGVAMQGCVGSGGEFRFHVRLGQLYRVISWCGGFLLLGETAAVGIPGTGACSGDRHDEHVAQVHTSGSVEMCLSESPDDGVTVDILGAISPAHRAGDRAGLNHAERSAGTGEGMPVVGSSDKGVHVLCVVCFRRFVFSGIATEQCPGQG